MAGFLGHRSLEAPFSLGGKVSFWSVLRHSHCLLGMTGKGQVSTSDTREGTSEKGLEVVFGVGYAATSLLAYAAEMGTKRDLGQYR